MIDGGSGRPILVTGAPRSGKTRVAHIIAQDSSFAHMQEPLTIWDPGLKREDDCLTAADATDTIRSRIRHLCEQAVQRAGKTRYIDDLSYHALRIGFAHRVLPEAKIVHVIRPPREAIPEMIYGWTYRDTFKGALARRRRNINIAALPRQAWRFLRNYVGSRLEGQRSSWGPDVPGLRKFARDHSVAEVAGFQWRAMIEIARRDLADLPDDQWLEVCRDQLLAAPYREAKRIAEFCEVSDAERIASYAAEFLDPNFVYTKKIHPTEEEWNAIFGHIGPLAEQLGYR